MGPPGTITRLHFDAAHAHGYLGQVQGRKLFVVFPPSDSPFLYRHLPLPPACSFSGRGRRLGLRFFYTWVEVLPY